MGIWGWLTVGGIAGAYYLIKNSEWGYFSSIEAAQAWINDGPALSEINTTIAAMRQVIGEFNDFMDDMLTERDNCEYFAEWMFYDDDGVKKFKNITYTFPNGLTLVILDGEGVANFRIPISESEWKGCYFPVALGVQRYAAMRLLRDPAFEFIVPGSEGWSYMDYDGVVRLGSDCTPPRSTTDTQVAYYANYTMFFAFVCDMLHRMGLVKTLVAWYQKAVLKASFKRIRTDISDVNDIVSEVRDILVEVSAETSASLSSTEFLNAIKKIGYRPYG